MQHKSLTAEITSKSKKHMQNFQPTFFSQIPYMNVTEINYLRDLQQKKQGIDFPIFEFQKDFGEQAPVNQFDMLANTLYKKIMQQGYIQQKKAPSKKKKKTKNPFQYDYEDAWINDQQAITVKKNIYVKLQNFKCLNQSIDQFYNSELYKSSIQQIQQQSKKRTNEISMDAQQLEEIKKKIKENISNTHSRMKQELEGEKATAIVQNVNMNDSDLKLQTQNKMMIENDVNASNEGLPLVETAKQEQAQQTNLISENKGNQPATKAQAKDTVDESSDKKTKKLRKTSAKAKVAKKSSKNQKKPKDDDQLQNEQNLVQNQVQNKQIQKGKQQDKLDEPQIQKISNQGKQTSENKVDLIEAQKTQKQGQQNEKNQNVQLQEGQMQIQGQK